MSNKIYTTVPVPRFPRNIFSLSRPVVGSMRMQRLYASEIIEILPGDAINMRQETFVRTAPLVAPPLARVTVQHHAFFVPGWQLHRDFDDFITGGEKMDFSDHLPYVWVTDIYQQIDGHLSLLVDGLDSGTNFTALPDYMKRSSFMDEIIAVIEGCDFSRACPFGMPEFLPLQTESSGKIVKIDDLTDDNFPLDEPDSVASAIQDIAQANWDAWRKYNDSSLSSKELRVNVLPFMAQLKIWCEFFRDENLCDDYWDEMKDPGKLGPYVKVDYLSGFNDLMSQIYSDQGVSVSDASLIEDGTEWRDVYILLGVKPRAWRKDRFTAALPWTQKGPDITIPLAGSLPISVDTVVPTSSTNYNLLSKQASDGVSKIINSGGYAVTLNGSADLSKASGMATMRDLRRAEAVEEFEEADGRFGNRYPENTLGQFGVYTPDSRLPRCQFLGSTSQTVGFGEIAQTSETGDTPLGTLAGKGTSYNPSFLFKQRFTMHGFVVVFTSITVQAMYEQGIHPMFSRFDRTEYGWPRYARLGEEPLYTKEICAVADNVDEDTVFGYAPRYSTYKSDTGSIHGQMKTTLNYWTFSRKFEKAPVLNEEFIYHEPRRDAFALTNPYAEQFYFEIDWKVRSSRLLPFFGVASI